MNIVYVLFIILGLSFFTLLIIVLFWRRNEETINKLNKIIVEQLKILATVDIRLQEREKSLYDLRESFAEQQQLNLKLLQENLQNNVADMRNQLTAILNSNIDNLANRFDKLTEKTDQRLREISNQVEQRLSDGFAKTTTIFTDVIKRLALIDEAQKKITDLSNNVVDLQTILSDKRSRGAFGEIQLATLIRNMIPASNFSLQHTLSNGKRADCILFLPHPTGDIVVDAKFPLESYKKLVDQQISESDKHAAEQQFRIDIRKHLQDIADKYIIPPETSDGAMMFIPAEAVFAEIHAHYHDLIELSHKLHVWMVSPTTMMAILTTARAVLKDAATRKQVHIIQEHLGKLALDFSRFQNRMDDLSKHINQAHQDVELVNTSAKKITAQFEKIEKVELQSSEENI